MQSCVLAMLMFQQMHPLTNFIVLGPVAKWNTFVQKDLRYEPTRLQVQGTCIPPASYQPPAMFVPSGAASFSAELPRYDILLVAGNSPDLCAS